MIRSANVGLMLGQRRRRWPNINPTLAECIVFVGLPCLQLKSLQTVLKILYEYVMLKQRLV